jgi:hypothetical protein
MLGLGRALGETMAVTFVIGNANKLSWSLFAAGNSISSTLANEFAEADRRCTCPRCSRWPDPVRDHLHRAVRRQTDAAGMSRKEGVK